jgi:hypothetical protein
MFLHRICEHLEVERHGCHVVHATPIAWLSGRIAVLEVCLAITNRV